MNLIKTTFYFLLLIQLSFSSSMAAPAKNEAEIKALFLCTILKYTKFNDTKKTYTIGVIGDTSFHKHLLKLQDRKINKRKIKFIFCKKAEELTNHCHVLFISRESLIHDKKILKKVSADTLTIGDNKWFIEHGGLINIVIKNKSIRWEANYKELEKRSFKVSSKILGCALNRKRK